MKDYTEFCLNLLESHGIRTDALKGWAIVDKIIDLPPPMMAFRINNDTEWLVMWFGGGENSCWVPFKKIHNVKHFHSIQRATGSMRRYYYSGNFMKPGDPEEMRERIEERLKYFNQPPKRRKQRLRSDRTTLSNGNVVNISTLIEYRRYLQMKEDYPKYKRLEYASELGLTPSKLNFIIHKFKGINITECDALLAEHLVHSLS